MKIDKSIYSALEKILNIQRLLTEKLNRVPTIDELSKECELDSKHVAKVLVAADGFGCS
jgi:DNA-directed RNA polymerase specialized sigma subunit